ncbi:MAG: stage sporulation protein [Acidimicrobiaceae bacterium]
MRKGVFVLFVTLAVAFTASPAARAQTGVPVVILDGRGFGHGVGLAQWGAKYLADAGAHHEDIIAKFYPGTDLSTAQGTVRVAVYTSPDNRSTLSFPNGGEVRSSPGGDQAPGFPVQVGPGGSVLVTYDGSYHVTPLVSGQSASEPVVYERPASAEQACIPLVNCPTTTTTTQPSGGGGGGGGCVVLCGPPTTPPTTAPPDTTSPPGTSPPPSDPGNPGDPGGGGGGSSTASSGAPVWAVPNGTTGVSERGRHYRGLIEATAGGGPLRLVNQLDVETYLKGMGEVPSNWPIEAIASQAVVARTYALRAMSFSGELCDYDLCQVYIGADREAAGQNDAVDATRGQVVTYGGSLATTVYSADAGGITATPLEGFGSDTTYPYLQVVRYDTPDPLPWRAEVALSDVASRFSYPGSVTDVKIGEAGPSGRALQVTLDGSAGPFAVNGRKFASSLGLRSTLFQPTITTDDNVPPPPPFGDAGAQALPEDAAAIQRAALTGDTAALGGPNLAALHDWGSKLASSLSRSAHHAKDLASNPAVWTAITLVLIGTAYVFGRGETPSPFAPQFVNELRFPMLRWPAEGLTITSPLARAQSSLEKSSRPRRTRPLRVRRKN